MHCFDDEYEDGLEYSEESTSEPDVDLENQYYLAKTTKEEHLENAIPAFQRVLDMQEDQSSVWGFKALKQLVKVNFQLKNYAETMRKYKQMLDYAQGVVTKNYAEKAINSILDFTSTSKDIGMLQEFYETTLEALKKAKNDRLWFKTNVKLGTVFLERGEYVKLANIIKLIKRNFKCDEEDLDPHQGTQLLEIYALEIQMYTQQKNNLKLKELYERCLRIRPAVSHPLITGVIRECGGKMHLRAGDFERAYSDFFEAFKNFDESGNPRRINCLKYLILNSMLTRSVINPLDSREARPYRDEPEIKAMTQLITAFQNHNTGRFALVYREHEESLTADPFVREHLSALLHCVRSNALLRLIKPYWTVRLSFLAERLGVTEEEVEGLLVDCISNGYVKGKIDQANGVLRMGEKTRGGKRDVAMDMWAESTRKLIELIAL